VGCCADPKVRLLLLLGAAASSGHRLGPKTMPASKQRRQPLAGRSKGPKTSFASNKSRRSRPSVGSVRKPRSPRFVAAGLVPRWARSEDLALLGREPSTSSAGSVGPKTSKARGSVDNLGRSEKWSRRSIPHEAVPKVRSSQPRPRLGTRWNMSTRVPSGVGRWAPLRALLEHSRTVPLLHFSLGFKDSETLLARRAQSHRSELGVGSLPPASL
jgi:hypothetical protein